MVLSSLCKEPGLHPEGAGDVQRMQTGSRITFAFCEPGGKGYAGSIFLGRDVVPN